jgi:thioredoxin reductase
MTTEEKAAAIIREMVKLANEDKPVTISQDFYEKFAVTIAVGDNHTHVGMPGEDGSFEFLIDNMYNAFHGGACLIWAEGKE